MHSTKIHHTASAPPTVTPSNLVGLTFAEYFKEYAARQIWAPQTGRAVDLAARTFPYRDLPLADLRSADIETWIRQMHDADLTPATIRTRYANLRAVLYAAVRDGHLESNPAVGVRLPRATGRALSADMPTAEQVAHLITASPAPYDLLFALCAYAGLRLGEARALRWSDIDLENWLIHIRRQARLRPGGGSELAEPKFGSYRTIPMEATVYRLLAARRAGTSEAIVYGPRGSLLHPGSIARVWTRQRTACGLPGGLRLHDLRHFYASSLLARGKNVLEVQRRLGHARPSTTLDVYAHLLGGSS